MNRSVSRRRRIVCFGLRFHNVRVWWLYRVIIIRCHGVGSLSLLFQSSYILSVVFGGKPSNNNNNNKAKNSMFSKTIFFERKYHINPINHEHFAEFHSHFQLNFLNEFYVICEKTSEILMIYCLSFHRSHQVDVFLFNVTYSLCYLIKEIWNDVGSSMTLKNPDQKLRSIFIFIFQRNHKFIFSS